MRMLPDPKPSSVYQYGATPVWLTLLILLVGLWVLFLVTVEGNVESAIMYLPLPIMTLLGLWQSRWWATRTSRLPFTREACP